VIPLPERRGPRCRGPDCLTENGPCQPGCNPEARAVNQPVSEPQGPEQTYCTSGNPNPQRHGRLRVFTGRVLLVSRLVAAFTTIAAGVHVLIELISKL